MCIIHSITSGIMKVGHIKKTLGEKKSMPELSLNAIRAEYILVLVLHYHLLKMEYFTINGV